MNKIYDMFRGGFVLFLLLWLCGCDMIEHHPYDARVEYYNLNETGIAQIEERTEGKTKIRFVWMGDTQRFWNETEDMMASINKIADLDFVVHGGDLTDFGVAREFTWNHEFMLRLKVPYVALIGNHDTLGSGKRVYEKMYGSDNFSFIAAHVKFVCLNTNGLEYSSGVPNIPYINEAFKHSADHQNTVTLMHAAPLCEQMPRDVSYQMQEQIVQSKGLLFCANAHGHSFNVSEPFEDGVTYYQCASAGERSYILFTIDSDTYTYENILF